MLADCNMLWKIRHSLSLLSYLYMPVDNLLKLFIAAGLWICLWRTQVGLSASDQRTSSSASSQCISLLCYQRATLSDASFENGSLLTQRLASSTTQNFDVACRCFSSSFKLFLNFCILTVIFLALLLRNTSALGKIVTIAHARKGVFLIRNCCANTFTERERLCVYFTDAWRSNTVKVYSI